MKCLKRTVLGGTPSESPKSTFTFLDGDKEVEVIAATNAFETGKDYPKEQVLPAAKVESDPDGEEA